MRFYSGFKRNVLTSGVEEMCFKNGSVEPARPCFEAWFSDVRIAIVDSRPPKCEPNVRFNCFPCNIYHLPLPSRETWLENAFHKWVRCSGQAMLFPCRSSLDARQRCVFLAVLNATF